VLPPGQKDYWVCRNEECPGRGPDHDRWGDVRQLLRDCRDVLHDSRCSGGSEEHEKLLAEWEAEYDRLARAGRLNGLNGAREDRGRGHSFRPVDVDDEPTDPRKWDVAVNRKDYTSAVQEAVLSLWGAMKPYGGLSGRDVIVARLVASYIRIYGADPEALDRALGPVQEWADVEELEEQESET
jgi:hypothetical protein